MRISSCQTSAKVFQIYFLGSNLAHKKTSDGGQTLTEFVTPLPAVQTVPALTFHMYQPSTLLFLGRKCDRNGACHNQAWLVFTFRTASSYDDLGIHLPR